MKFLLDTNICINLLKYNDKHLAKKMSYYSAEDFVICSIVKAELLFGARNSEKVSENLKLLDEFFQYLVSLPFDDEASEIYAGLRAFLKKSGHLISSLDLMIASIAKVHRLTLISRNEKEFRQVPGLSFEVW